MPTHFRVFLSWGAAILMVALWYFSQSPWSHFQQITSERNWSGYREYSEARTGDEIGANFYFGGSFVLLLAAAGLVGMTVKGDSSDRLPGVITLGTAALGVIALVRFNSYLNSFPAPQLLRYGGGGHYASDEVGICLVVTLALGVVGTILLILGPAPAPKPETSSATEST